MTVYSKVIGDSIFHEAVGPPAHAQPPLELRKGEHLVEVTQWADATHAAAPPGGGPEAGEDVSLNELKRLAAARPRYRALHSMRCSAPRRRRRWTRTLSRAPSGCRSRGAAAAPTGRKRRPPRDALSLLALAREAAGPGTQQILRCPGDLQTARALGGGAVVYTGETSQAPCATPGTTPYDDEGQPAEDPTACRTQ